MAQSFHLTGFMLNTLRWHGVTSPESCEAAVAILEQAWARFCAGEWIQQRSGPAPIIKRDSVYYCLSQEQDWALKACSKAQDIASGEIWIRPLVRQNLASAPVWYQRHNGTNLVKIWATRGAEWPQLPLASVEMEGAQGSSTSVVPGPCFLHKGEFQPMWARGISNVGKVLWDPSLAMSDVTRSACPVSPYVMVSVIKRGGEGFIFSCFSYIINEFIHLPVTW